MLGNYMYIVSKSCDSLLYIVGVVTGYTVFVHILMYRYLCSTVLDNLPLTVLVASLCCCV